MNGLVAALGAVAVASVLPIWRGAGHTRHDGVNLWRLLHDTTRDLKTSKFGHPHIRLEEATTRARRAWELQHGG